MKTSCGYKWIYLSALMSFVLEVSLGQGLPNEIDYCTFSKAHTLCQFKNKISASCGNVTYRGIKDQGEKNIIVQIHNELRSKIANGLEERGDPGPMPSAANMIELTWDEELAIEAQTWADQCITDHDCPSCRKLSRFPVGQNLYSFGHIPGIFEGSWKRAINGWYDEVVDFRRDHVDPFKIRKGVLVGHSHRHPNSHTQALCEYLRNKQHCTLIHETSQ
uniref:Venom allergen 5.02 n=2 Tax=Caligus rogercresseyi TaxID=217165 RepID=C1BMF7_CALRO|nr:Venom allergen 5.02 precursor [Caligus rogercresseyi]